MWADRFIGFIPRARVLRIASVAGVETNDIAACLAKIGNHAQIGTATAVESIDFSECDADD